MVRWQLAPEPVPGINNSRRPDHRTRVLFADADPVSITHALPKR